MLYEQLALIALRATWQLAGTTQSYGDPNIQITFGGVDEEDHIANMQERTKNTKKEKHKEKDMMSS
jgi:hypothetical protein